MASNEIKKRAEILLEALPYLQKYEGKTIVVKYGGNAMTNERLKNFVMKDIVLLTLVGMRVVLVHGGGPEITAALKLRGKKAKFIDGLRYTDAETANIVCEVLSGGVNKSLIALIHKCGGRAVGLCGLDGGMLLSEKLDEKLGFVGRVKKVDANPILSALSEGYIPVIASVGVDAEGQIYNINADTAAAEIAAALKAEKLIYLTDTRGVLKNKNNEKTLIPEIALNELPKLIESGIIDGGMLPKIESVQTGIRKGVNEAVIIDGRIEHSIILELFSDEGSGTLFHK